MCFPWLCPVIFGLGLVIICIPGVTGVVNCHANEKIDRGKGNEQSREQDSVTHLAFPLIFTDNKSAKAEAATDVINMALYGPPVNKAC
jgi:hypothetical protein